MFNQQSCYKEIQYCISILDLFVSVIMFSHISVSFACMGLTFFGRVRGPIWMVSKNYKIKKIRPGDIMKESMWMFDIDYVTQNNRSLYNC